MNYKFTRKNLGSILNVYLRRFLGISIISNKYFASGSALDLDLNKKFGIEPKIVFDVGANIGQTTYSYRHKFRKSMIYSFEPFNQAFVKLVQMSKGMKNVETHNIALSDKAGSRVVATNTNTHSVLNSLNPKINSKFTGPSEKIDLDTIDNFCLKHAISEIDLLKIDVEGHELEVIKGATGMISQGKISAIIAEVALHSNNSRNSSLTSLIEVLERLDFIFVDLYDNSFIQLAKKSHYANALFISSHKVQQPL